MSVTKFTKSNVDKTLQQSSGSTPEEAQQGITDLHSTDEVIYRHFTAIDYRSNRCLVFFL
jgi:hypothetical protein